MNGRQPSDDSTSGACQLEEHKHCHGNLDLKAGPGPAVPLHRCACWCHHGHIRQPRHT